MPIDAQLANDGKSLTLFVHEDLSLQETNEFWNTYKHAPYPVDYFFVDMAKARMTDASPLGMMLLLLRKSGNPSAQLHIVNCNINIKELLEQYRLDKLFNVTERSAEHVLYAIDKHSIAPFRKVHNLLST